MLRRSTTDSGWTIHFDDLTEVAMECRNGESNVSLETVEDVILALHKIGHLALPASEGDGEGEDKCANWKPIGAEDDSIASSRIRPTPSHQTAGAKTKL